MASWLEHPKYVPARERLVGYLHSDRYRFRRLAPVLFLCGGANSSRRDTLRDYLRKYFPSLRLFYAERVWEHIASHSNESALQMESHLAALADLVVIIVESPGTYTELGAFSLSDPLRKKLLPIVDKKFHREESFISTGPLRWIDRESDFGPTIYVSLGQILLAIGEIENRLERIPKSGTTRISDLASSPKHLLFFLCDLVGVIHPATPETVEYYLRRIVASASGMAVDVPTLIGLGLAMGLLRKKTLTIDGQEHSFIVPAAPHPLDHPFHHTRHLDLPSRRAEHASVLLTIPLAKMIMDEFGRAP